MTSMPCATFAFSQQAQKVAHFMHELKQILFTPAPLKDSPAALRPVVLAAVGRRREFLELGGPEPAVDIKGLEIGSVAALEVAQTSRSPDVLHVICKIIE